jgi:hypothetical protein
MAQKNAKGEWVCGDCQIEGVTAADWNGIEK